MKKKYYCFLLIFVLSFSNVVFAENSLDDFDFTEMDNKKMANGDTYYTVFQTTIDYLKKSNSLRSIKENLFSMTYIRDPRFIPYITEFLENSNDTLLRKFACERMADYSDTSNINYLPYPNGVRKFAIDSIAIPCLKKALSDTSLKVQAAASFALFYLGDTESAYVSLTGLILKNYFNVFDGFYYRRLGDYAGELSNKKYDSSVIEFVDNYINNNNDVLRSYAALYFARIGEFNKALPVANDLLIKSTDPLVINIANKIKELYRKEVR